MGEELSATGCGNGPARPVDDPLSFSLLISVSLLYIENGICVPTRSIAFLDRLPCQVLLKRH